MKSMYFWTTFDLHDSPHSKSPNFVPSFIPPDRDPGSRITPLFPTSETCRENLISHCKLPYPCTRRVGHLLYRQFSRPGMGSSFPFLLSSPLKNLASSLVLTELPLHYTPLGLLLFPRQGGHTKRWPQRCPVCPNRVDCNQILCGGCRDRIFLFPRPIGTPIPPLLMPCHRKSRTSSIGSGRVIPAQVWIHQTIVPVHFSILRTTHFFLFSLPLLFAWKIYLFLVYI